MFEVERVDVCTASSCGKTLTPALSLRERELTERSLTPSKKAAATAFPRP
jgi:hypothetical protein